MIILRLMSLLLHAQHGANSDLREKKIKSTSLNAHSKVRDHLTSEPCSSDNKETLLPSNFQFVGYRKILMKSRASTRK